MPVGGLAASARCSTRPIARARPRRRGRSLRPSALWRAKARTSTSIPNTRTPSRSCCQSRLVSMSASIAANARRPDRSGRCRARLRPRSKVKGPENTDSASNAALRLGVEQPHAPLDRAAHRPLPLRQVARAADEQTQRGVEARRGSRAATSCACGPRPARSRAARRPAARTIPAMCGACSSRHPERGIDRHGALDEQRHGARLRGILRRGHRARAGSAGRARMCARRGRAAASGW